MSATFSITAVLAVFYIVFLSQIFLISIYYPTIVRRRVLYVLDNYPPARYPKLYPKPLDAYADETSKQRLHNYRNVNYVIAAVGLMILSAMVASGYRPDVKGGDEIFVLMYFFLQMGSLLFPGLREFKQLRLMREAFAAGTMRTANLNPRRLFDFISPVYVAAAILLYVAWLVFYLSGKDLSAPWEAEVYVSLLVITGVNLSFAGMIARFLYGKKRNPHQAYEDQLKEIGLVVKSSVFTSIGMSIFLTTADAADRYGLEIFDPPIVSIFMQLCVLFGIGLSFRTLKVEAMDFEVYKDDTAQPST